MNGPANKITTDHLRRGAYLYVRQSTIHQVRDNRESTARQYDLQGRAQALGWSREQIVVIDEDLGLSGASASNRNGFQRLVADVGLGRVGMVMGLEVSRLARSSSDWHRLLEICALSETLILDEDGIYDPSHFNDRLLLGLKGTMSEAELHVLRARLIGGAMNKARRGELWLRPPIGYAYDNQKRLVFDPDEQIQSSVRLVFEIFQSQGSAERVVRHFAKEKIFFPQRIKTGPRAGEVLFVPLAHSRMLNLLHNPRYAGAYVFGRTRQRKLVLAGQMRNRKLPREEWKVFLPNTCPGYITWEQFEANQAKLLENANAHGADRRKGPPREGAALLQGMVLCGLCGKRMTVRYYIRQGHPVPDYVCQRRGIEFSEPVCQVVCGTGLDEAVGKVILESVTSASLDVALEVFEELRARKAQTDRLRRLSVERARQEAESAQRQYLLVRPENRLVADSLERQWNEKLLRLRQVQEDYERISKTETPDVSAEAKARIQALASDLPGVWNDPRTPMRERKRMLRLLVDDVTLVRNQNLRVSIRWKGGATTSLELPLPKSGGELRKTPAAIIEKIRALATEKTDSETAAVLNGNCLKSGMGQSFTQLLVRNVRMKYNIPGFRECLRKTGWLTVEEMAAQLKVHHQTAKAFGLQGVLRAVRSNDKGELLFEPPVGPLPKAHQGKKLKDRRQFEKLAAQVVKEVQYAA